MCLTLLSNKTKSKIAIEDIICYKRLDLLPKIIDKSSIKDGDEFTGVINNMECSGKISVESNKIYFCTNHPNLNGADSKNKHGYINSWIFDITVTSIIINNKEVIDLKLVTPYRLFPIEIGKTYTSELIKIDEDIYEGLHSYKNSEDAKKYYNGIYAECIIPKGSKYYEGKFIEKGAYASDKLAYVKIIGNCSKQLIIS